ncbi:hypothetical protein BDF21DRAFT_412178 [Thamnidium elegans]|nr:hypothetical protein BDF21DRAFT_412178 [Thamnidium elegans]
MLEVNSIIPSDNVHATQTRQALHQFKKLTSDLNGWDLTLEEDNVKLYKKKLDDVNLPPLVRGDTVLTDLPAGCTPLAVATVATLPGCRKIWDDKFEVSKVLDYYTRYESLFWVKLKAPWPISPRDFAGTTIRDVEPETVHCSVVSVKDKDIPDTPRTVRGELIVSGWKLFNCDQGIGITYVSQVDLAGSLPSAFLKKLLLQIPLCAGKVRDYISTYGFVPTTVIGRAQFKGEEFDHDARTYTLELNGDGNGIAETLCSERMYKDGIQVHLEGSAEMVQDSDNNHNPRIVLNNIKGPIKLVIKKK